MAGTQLPLLNKYFLDSSTIIDIWGEEVYPSSSFPTLRPLVVKQIDNGTIISCMEVYEELKSISDEVSKFAEEKKEMFIEMDENVIMELRKIFNKYQEMAAIEKTEADPFIVAFAKSRGLTVITSEKKSLNPSPSKPKIPNLCDEFNVRCINFNEYILEMGWIFSSV